RHPRTDEEPAVMDVDGFADRRASGIRGGHGRHTHLHQRSRQSLNRAARALRSRTRGQSDWPAARPLVSKDLVLELRRMSTAGQLFLKEDRTPDQIITTD